MTRPAGTSNRIVVRWLIDPHFAEMVKRLEDCSDHHRGGCDYCPHEARCQEWWHVICGRLEDRMMTDVDYVVYVAEFERIRGNGINLKPFYKDEWVTE